MSDNADTIHESYTANAESIRWQTYTHRAAHSEVGEHPGLVLSSPSVPGTSNRALDDIFLDSGSNKSRGCQEKFNATTGEDEANKRARTHTSAQSSISEQTRSRSIATSAASTSPLNENTVVKPTLNEIPKLLMVDLQQSDADSVLIALKRLKKVLKIGGDKEKRKQAILMGGVTLVLLQMQKWRNHEQIQVQGCLCLGWFNCPLDSTTHKVSLETGSVEVMTTALKTFFGSLNVNTYACEALALVLRLDVNPDVSKPLTFKFVREYGGLQLILDAMKAFPDNARLQRHCCEVLQNLAKGTELRKPLIAAGSVECVAKAIRTHMQDETFGEYGSSFMAELFSEAI